MNKKEFIGALASQAGCNQAEAGDMLNAFCEVVTNQMKQGDGSKVVIPGFGQFVAKHRPSREMRNPATGQKMMSKAKTSAAFSPLHGTYPRPIAPPKLCPYPPVYSPDRRYDLQFQ